MKLLLAFIAGSALVASPSYLPRASRDQRPEVPPRFYLVASDALAAPREGNVSVNGVPSITWKYLNGARMVTIKDAQTGQCFVFAIVNDAPSGLAQSVCPTIE